MSEYTTHVTLLERLSAGADSGAWREFHDRYGMLIWGMARRQGLQAADCDEVIQDVLTSLTRAMPNFTYDPARGKFRGYLKTVTLRVIIAHRNHQHPPVVGMEPLINHVVQDHDLEKAWEIEWRQHHLRSAMKVVENEFNTTDRAAFDAYAIRGENAETTAQSLGISANRVYQAKSRILKRLEDLIEIQVRDEG